MGIVGQRPSGRVTKAPRHSEVNQESSTGLEPKNQILAPSLERLHPLALELGADGDRLERAHETGVVDLDALEPPTDDVRLERATDRFHFG